MDKKTLEIVMRARDEVSATMKKISTQSKSAGRAIKRGFEAARKAARLAARAIRGVAAAIKVALGPIGLIASALGILSGVGLASMIRASADAQDSIGKLSQRLGVTTEFLSEMEFVAERSGVKVEALGVGMQRATRRFAEFASTGGGAGAAAIQTLEQFVPGLEDSIRAGKSFEELLPQIADGFASMTDQAAKVRAAFGLFDSEGVSFVQFLQEGSTGVQDLRDRARELGLTITNDAAAGAAAFNDALSDLFASLRGVRNALGVEIFRDLARMLTDLSDWVAENRESIVGFFGEIFEAAKGIGTAIRDAIEGDTQKLDQALGIMSDFMQVQLRSIGEIAGASFLRGITNVISGKIIDALSLPGLPGMGLRSLLDVDVSDTINRASSRMGAAATNALTQLQELNDGAEEVIATVNGGTPGGGGGPPQPGASEYGPWAQFADGFKEAAKAIEDEFENLKKIGDRFARDMHAAISGNMLARLTQEFESFADAIENLFRDLVRSTLAILSDSFASNVVGLFQSLLGALVPAGLGVAAPALNPNAPIPLTSDGLGLPSNFINPPIGDPFTVPTGGQGFQGFGFAEFGALAAPTAVPSAGKTEIHIHAIDAKSFEERLQESPGAIVGAVIQAVNSSNTTRNNLATGLGR